MIKDLGEEELAKIIKKAGGDTMPSLAQKWIDQGMQQGMQKDMQQDMVRQAREMVLDALETRFGNYPLHFGEKIVQMTDREKLKQILRMVVRAESLEEVEKEITWN